MGKIVVRVPATVTNVGNEISSLGLAFQLYTTVIVEEETDHWIVNHSLEGIPHDSNNLIVQTILRVNPKIAPHQLTLMSDIPRIPGVGYRTAFVIAGIKIANGLGRMQLTKNKEIQMGHQVMSFVRGVSVGILGDLTTVGSGNKVIPMKIKMPQIAALLYVMKNPFKIKKNLKNIKISSAQKLLGITSFFVMSIVNHHWGQASKLIESDPVFQRDLIGRVPDLKVIRSVAHRFKIYGTYLDRRGPVIITLGQRDKLSQLRDSLNQRSQLNGIFKLVEVDHNGASVRGE